MDTRVVDAMLVDAATPMAAATRNFQAGKEVLAWKPGVAKHVGVDP